MGRKRGLLLAVALAVMFVFPTAGSGGAGDGVPRMSKEELKGLLGSPDVVVLDVRLDGGVAPSRIAGALYEAPDKVDSWAGKYARGKRIVLYCS
jgi:hypothetical protein